MIDIETQKMYQLIKKYKPDDYTACSPEDTIFINNYINKKLQEKDFNILYEMQSVDTERYQVDQNVNLHTHYENLYKEFGLKKYPTYFDRKISYSHNIKNVYNRNRNIDDPEGLNRIGSIFKKISNPHKGSANKAVKDLADNYNIVFNIIEGNSFDGECRFQKSQPDDIKSFIIISVTQGSLKANDDALAVLLGHELSHGIDISKLPNNYIGTIGWEAPEDFANIMGAKIAQNAGYAPTEFIKTQGTNNDKTQRAADMINRYVVKLSALKNKNQVKTENTTTSERFNVLRGIGTPSSISINHNKLPKLINKLKYLKDFKYEKK